MAKKQNQKNKTGRIFFLPAILFIVLLVLILLSYQIFITDKFYPQTWVGNTNISFLTKGQAIRRVETNFNQRTGQKLQFTYEGEQFSIDTSMSSANLDYSAITALLDENNSKTFINRFKEQLITFIFSKKIYPKVSLLLDKQADMLASAVEKDAQDAQLNFNEITTPEGSPSAQIQIKAGIDGINLDRQKLEEEIVKFLLTDQYNQNLPVKVITPQITTFHVQRAKEALLATLKDPIKLTSGEQTWNIEAKQLLTLLDLTSGKDLLLDNGKTLNFLKKIAGEIDQEVQEGLFEFNPVSKRVTAFKPSQEGKKMDVEKTYQLITNALINPSDGELKNIPLPVEVIKPKIQTSDVNSLGIKELLGRGISNFSGSIPNRIYNVNLTAQKINGVLIPPGEIFSFNKTVGDISAATGFKQAYVIKEGRTVLDDGGGVCQDSTTLFRAVLNAGLPVVKRTAHAYRVGYYEQGFPPGLDATVFYPSVDFQFKNDTNHHILIQAYTSGLTLYIDLYGTSDGRQTTLTKPVVTNSTPPPADLRQDDPTLQRGQVKQVDWPAWGATVTFKRIVTKTGQTIIDETFKSNYKAWQAVYLIGIKDN